MVLGGQTRAEQLDGREAHGARLEHLQDDGKATRGARHRDAVVRLLLGEGQHLPAVREERAMARAQMNVTRIELSEVRNEEHQGASLAGGEVFHASDELRVGKTPQGSEKVGLHSLFVSGVAVRPGPDEP